MSLCPEARGFIDTEERRPSGEGPALMLAMSKTFVAVFHHHQRNPHRGTPRRAPMTGFFGTDFWHAVEFSRNGRAPVRVSRPVVGQPIHAMSAAAPLSKRIRGCHNAPRTCDREGHRAPGVLHRSAA